MNNFRKDKLNTHTANTSINISFLDGVRRSKENPSTFTVPSDGTKDLLVPGDLVKVAVTGSPNTPGERFWVRLSKADNGVFRGKITNSLVFTEAHGLDLFDTISFEVRHILDIETVEQQEVKRSEKMELLEALEDVYHLPDGNGTLYIEKGDLKTLSLATIPEGISLNCFEEKMPDFTLSRIGEEIVAEFSDAISPDPFGELTDAKIYCDAFNGALRKLRIKGFPIVGWSTDDPTAILWEMRFPVSSHPDEMLSVMKAICDRAQDAAVLALDLNTETIFLTREDLQQMGYRFSGEILENAKERLQIVGLEIVEDGAPAEIAFCCPLHRTEEGFIIPHPLQHYIGQANQEEAA